MKILPRRFESALATAADVRITHPNIAHTAECPNANPTARQVRTTKAVNALVWATLCVCWDQTEQKTPVSV